MARLVNPVAGLPSEKAFYMGLGSTALGFVGTVASWPLMSFAGRRTIYNNGLYVLTVMLFIIGFLDLAPHYGSNQGVIWAQASLMDIWTFVYDLR
jgi:SP family general alpha glucoside:H+ symporter-like MFS transporter